MYVCCGSSLTDDLPSAVWPAGLAASACVRVLWLLPDRQLANCSLARPVCFDNFVFYFASYCSTFSSLSPFNSGVKAKIVMEMCGVENSKYTQIQVKGMRCTLFHIVTVHVKSYSLMFSASGSSVQI